MQALEARSKLMQISQTLIKNDYFSRGPLPGYADAVIFKLLLSNKKYPGKQIYPYFYHWFVIMKQFSLTALDGWIQQKLYVQQHAEKCITLMTELYGEQPQHALKTTNRRKTLKIATKNSLSTSSNQSALQPIDINSPTRISSKAQYFMIVQVLDPQKVELVLNRINRLKIKIKQLKFQKKQKSFYLRCVVEKNLFGKIKRQIQTWDQVKRVIGKLNKAITENSDNKKLMRTIYIR